MKKYRVQQNTHWYKIHKGMGYTADPFQAERSELVRVGFHVCEARGCEEIHACSAEEFLEKIDTEEARELFAQVSSCEEGEESYAHKTAEKSTSGSGAKGRKVILKRRKTRT